MTRLHGGPDAESDPARSTAQLQMDSDDAPRELLAAWVHFLRDDLKDAVNALNSRLTVIALAAETDDPRLTPQQKANHEQIKTEVGRAAKITSSLLHRINAAAPDSIPKVLGRYDGAALGSAAILLVEDDDASRTVMAKLFDRLGHRVTAVTNGLDAFEVIKEQEVDCIIADLRMPYVGGRTLFEQVEERMPHMASRFVFVTGDYTNPESRSFLDNSGQPVVGKPYELDVLLAAVAQVVARQTIARNN